MASSLGISFGYHDSGVALIKSCGEVYAEHEERFTRVKFDSSYPEESLRWLVESGLTNDILGTYFYEDPRIKQRRLIWQYLKNPPKSEIRSSVIDKIKLTNRRNFTKYMVENLSNIGITAPIKFVRHHESHAASSFFTSKFNDSAILVVDGVGEFDCTSVWSARNNKLNLVKNFTFPNSLGLFYAAFTSYCGFKVNSGEYKFMGLAPYGKPIFKEIILNNFLNLDSSGLYKVNHKKLGLAEFDGFKFEEISKLLNHSKRHLDEPITNFHADVAASVQACLNLAMTSLARYSLRITGQKFLCISGGVGLNCVSNQKISEVLGEEKTFFFSASGDSGGALGAAALGYFQLNKKIKLPTRFDINFSKIGRVFSEDFCETQLNDLSIPYRKFTLNENVRIIANSINEGKVVGIFHGRSEFGPRALGNRSILADARIPKGQILINNKIKFRESFRPFAPIVLEEQAEKFFEITLPSPYMLKTVQVKNFKRKKTSSVSATEHEISITKELDLIDSPIPAATHLDGSARVQTISLKDTSISRKILEEFYSLTGCPILINTSFNVRGEPIVSTPFDALNCFMTTGIDLLYLEGCLILKSQISEELLSRFVSKYLKD
jgi:carbamoyltransferase